MSENFDRCFDLLGDPIPEGFGKRGRPPHLPTQQNRNKVMLLQAIGWPDGRIANALSITTPTLRKHYFRELKVRAEARDRVDGALMQRCWDEAQKGNVGAIKEFARMLDRADILRIDFAKPAAKEPKPPTLGKKEQARAEAERAHNLGGWEDLYGVERPLPELKPDPAWRFACPDWEQRLRRGASLLPDLPLNEDAAARAVAVFNRLRLPDVLGQPALAEAAGDWQRDIVRAVFGSVDATGVRRVAEVFNLVPKKNSKTTGGAAIMLMALMENKRPRAEFVLVGPTQEVADTAFQQVVGMIEADPYLRKRFQVQDHLKTVIDRLPVRGRLKIKTFDLKVATGSKPVGVLIDELHVMSQMSYATRVIGQLRGGLIANPEGFLIFITTQSEEPPAGVFKQELDYARGVRDGRITEDVRILPLLYEFPEAMQRHPSKPWADPKNWPMVMPNLGRSLTIERLVPELRTAREKGDEEERRWASQHLNVEIGLALHSDRWIGADYWLAAVDRSITLESLIADSDVIVAGVDGGGLDDLYGLCLIGRHRESRDWRAWFRAWAQPDVLQRRKEIAPRLMDFASDGDLVICAQPTQDIREIADIIEAVRDAGLLPEKAGVGLDPVGVAGMIDELAARDIGGEQLAAVPQGFRLSAGVWGMERKLKDGTFWHAGSRMMAWCVGNAKVEQRGNAILITKQAAGKAKIDPLIAGFDAVMLMSRNPESLGPSVYEKRGILMI